MVRNEERALPRLLRSAAKVCQYAAITDTGSTDNTIEVAKATCAELGIICDIRQHPWQDFGTNRTLNLQHGRDVAQGNPNAWLLLMDADMEVPAGVDWADQLPPLGMLPQATRNGQTWWNIRIAKADLPLKYTGRTHEYIDHGGVPVVQCQWFTIIDHCDGGCRADKFERDERLLRLDLAEKNDNRSRFYLAESLRALGRKHEAKALYDERAKHEDFPEEAWMARHMAARCCDGAEADLRALKAYFTRPQRLEPIMDVAKRAADAGDHRFALGLVDVVTRAPTEPPASETLWTDADAYRWTRAYVEMISSYYVGDRGRGLAACEYLRLTEGSPYQHTALENVRFYVDPVPGVRKPLPFTAPDGFVPMNPSLLQGAIGVWLGLIRTVNYRIDDRGAYLQADGSYFTRETPVITRNFIQVYDSKFLPWGEPQELVSPPSPVANARIRGFEDMRFVSHNINDGTLVTAGVRLDTNPQEVPEFWEATWNSDGSLRESRRLSEPGRCEKNWLPRPGGGYQYDVLTTVDEDGKNPDRSVCNLDVGAFRGSAAPIYYHEGQLSVIHEVSTPGGGKRVYLHRFIWRGEKGRTRISRPFLLRGDRPCIECCFSINHTPDGILMSCSWEDREIYTITVPHDWVQDGIELDWAAAHIA
jgi:hypothetical protein